MTVGDPGNESYQFLPGFPANRILLDKKVGGYDRTAYDPSTAATQIFYGVGQRGSDFTKDLSQGTLGIFLESPRQFWLRFNGAFAARLSGASFTINERIGTLAEASTDVIRASGTLSRVGAIPHFSGTPLADMVPWIHPTDPDFFVDLCGRRPYAQWRWARTRGILYQRPTDPYARFNVYGMPDDILEYTDEDGQPWLVIIDYKSTSSKPSKWQEKVTEWWNPRHSSGKFHRAYIRQLEFYAWMMERIVAREGLPHRVHPIGHHIIFNAGHGSQVDFTTSLDLQLESAHTETPLDWSWVEPTIDLAIECILDPNLPPKQAMPSPPNSRTGRVSTVENFHDFDVMDNRYEWMRTNHPGSWP
ncbi:MAG: PD-(D/E)XK nuclease family protein [Candidatus Poseidonia sp.]|nr:PD-(D/E)XK nuclease family protein [Poseidonia sp.]